MYFTMRGNDKDERPRDYGGSGRTSAKNGADMKLIAKGNTAEIYEYGENRICILFYPGYLKEYVRHEFCNELQR
ncbi:MAG: hypothetical protein IKK33_00395 [Lachnospiraceae bacterium]|nr:hypothetical protein [Lachnospiraceae bacterium]